MIVLGSIPQICCGFPPSPEVQSQKTDAHALEESDRTILSMDQTNKEERPSAETREKRVRAKENIDLSNTNRHRMGHECHRD